MGWETQTLRVFIVVGNADLRFPTKYGVTTLLVDAVSNCALQTRFEVLSS